MASTRIFVALALALLASPAMGRGPFRKAPTHGDVNPELMQGDLMFALQQSLSKLGSGGLDVQEIGARLWGVFSALARSKDGKLEDSAVRYLAHTFFLKEYGWLIRGLDPHRAEGENTGEDNKTRLVPDNYNDIPGFLVSLLEGRSKDHGLSLSRAVAYVATMGNLILHEGSQRLETAYALNHFETHDLISGSDLAKVLDSYVILLVSEQAAPTVAEHEMDRTRLHESWSDFPQMQTLSTDIVQNMIWMSRNLASPFQDSTYSIVDASEAMTIITQHYGKVRDVQCHQLKDGLVEMDGHMTGRVPLTSFYGKHAVGPWALAESPEYLRQLGALDETAEDIGPQVIISNYVTAVSNCDSPSEYYSICCIHECQDLLNSLETAIESASAPPEWILELVSNLPSETIEAPRNLSSTLVDTLKQVAQLHDGEVPLHSRLFLQWLHYAFPQECPYPHVTGTINPLTPSEWFEKHGQNGDASEAEVQQTMKLNANKNATEHYMSQWTLEEEILTSWPSTIAQAHKEGAHSIMHILRILCFILGPVSLVLGMLWSNAKDAKALVSSSKKIASRDI